MQCHVQQAEAHARLGEMMQQLALICSFASFHPSAAEEVPSSLLPAAALIAEMPQANKQGLRELVYLIDSHLTKRVVGPTAQPGNPTAEESSITHPVCSDDLSSALAAWRARTQHAKGPTVPFKADQLRAADKQASVSSQAQAWGPPATDPVEAARNALKETLLSGQQEAPRHGDSSSNRVKSTRERLREKLNAIAAAGEGIQAAETPVQSVSTSAVQSSMPLAPPAASAMAAALGLESGPGAADVPEAADMSDAPEAKPAKKMGKNQRRKAAAEASKAQQPAVAAGNADSAAVQPEAATSSSSEGTASGPGSPAQVSPRPIEGDSKAATSSQESKPAQPSSTSQAEAASAHSSLQDIAEAGQGQAARSDSAPVSSEAVAGGQQLESADASSKAAASVVQPNNSAQASTKATVSISRADVVQANGKADAVRAASKAANGNRKADTTSASSRAAAEVAEPISAQTSSTSLAGTGTAENAHASNIADTSMAEAAAAAQADSKADAGKTEPAAAQAGNTAAATQAVNGSAAAVAQPSSGDTAFDGANKEGTANKNTVLSQSDKAADKDTQAQLAQKPDQPATSAAAVPPAGIAAHRPRVPKAVLRATAAPYTPLSASAAVSKAKGIAMGELDTPYASACHSFTLSAHFFCQAVSDAAAQLCLACLCMVLLFLFAVS